jgi:hypothetical protein
MLVVLLALSVKSLILSSLAPTPTKDFSVFNELSLPLNVRTAQAKFGLFFKLLEKLSDKGLNQIRKCYYYPIHQSQN